MQYIPQEEPTWQQLPPTKYLPPYQWQPSSSLPPGTPPNRGLGRGGKNAILIMVGLAVLALLGLSILGASAYVAFQFLPTSTNQTQTTPTQSPPTVISTSPSLASTVMPTPIPTTHAAGPQATVTPGVATTRPTPSATPGRHRFRGHHHRRKSG